jgi:hypothetical protein
MKVNEITGLEFLKEIIETTLFSAYLKNEKPLSTLIVARPEHGKTEILLQYAGNKGVEVIQDTTSFGLVNYLFPKILSQEIKHIIFPSFEKIFTRNKVTINQVLTCINNIVEEGIGIASIFTKNITFPSQGKVARAGVIIGCVPDLIREHRTILQRYGFWSRMLPICYGYAEEDLSKIHEEIKEGINPFHQIKLKFPSKPKEVILPKEVADEMDVLVNILRIPTASYTGFRLRRHLQTYVKALALRKGKKEVGGEEIKDLYAISPFIFQPLSADECCWKIIRAISEKPRPIDELVKLTKYSKATVYRRVEDLKRERLVELRNSIVYPIISFSRE